MTRRWSAAVLVLSVVGVGQAGEKDIIERLEKARAIVVILEGESHASSVMIRNQNADANLAELCELPGLEMLILNGTKLTNVGMHTVGGLTGLRCLDLGDTAITDAGLKEIKSLHRLTQLTLSNTCITNTGLEELTGLKDLGELYLEATAVSDEGMTTVRGMHGLNRLCLNCTRVTDIGVAELAVLSSLSVLYLQGCPNVTDASVNSLSRMKGLTYVDLRESGVTEEGLARLRKALPRCEFLFNKR